MPDNAVQIVFDPHIRNALQAIGLALLIMVCLKFKEYINRQARKR